MSKLGLALAKDETVEQMAWQIWMTSDRQSAVHAIDDFVTKVRYLSIRGKKEGALAKQLAEGLPVWTRDDLLKHALELLRKGSDEDRQRAAFEVAAEMDEYDAASAGVLTAFIKMDEPGIRLAGARALRTRPWTTFRSTAEQLSADPEPEVAAIGKEMLARIQELHGQ
ncbi:hypothetical protein [Corallococcus carmarthensis]|nr:hypothetical protein [Corallococcus carmarthensis]NOK17385.1 hypothetical protein [Corallococcus carmarthensis]